MDTPFISKPASIFSSRQKAMDTEFDCHDYDRFALYDPAFYFVQEELKDEEFNVFHTSERKLFHRLVNKLGRNVDESKHVVAFLIWLERTRYSHNAVHKVTAWPFHLVDQLAYEIAGLLRFLEQEKICRDYICLYSVQKLCTNPVKLFQFRRKRVEILGGVGKIMSEVCSRAFKDILTGDSEFVDEEGDRMWLAHINPVTMPPPYHNVASGFGGNSGSGNVMDPTNNIGNVSEDLSEMFVGMQLGDGHENEPDVAADDIPDILQGILHS